MRLVLIFLWIVVGAIILWFFTLNLDQRVDIDLFNRVFEGVNLVTVIFITLFIGVVIGSLLFASQVFKAKSQVVLLKKENTELQKETDNLRNYSVQQDTNIEPDVPNNVE